MLFYASKLLRCRYFIIIIIIIIIFIIILIMEDIIGDTIQFSYVFQKVFHTCPIGLFMLIYLHFHHQA